MISPAELRQTHIHDHAVFAGETVETLLAYFEKELIETFSRIDPSSCPTYRLSFPVEDVSKHEFQSALRALFLNPRIQELLKTSLQSTGWQLELDTKKHIVTLVGELPDRNYVYR